MTAAEYNVRVWVEDVWDTVEVAAEPDWTVTQVKQAALQQAVGGSADPADYLVKLRGAAVLNEAASLTQVDVLPHTTLTVLAARRRPDG